MHYVYICNKEFASVPVPCVHFAYNTLPLIVLVSMLITTDMISHACSSSSVRTQQCLYLATVLGWTGGQATFLPGTITYWHNLDCFPYHVLMLL